MRSLVFTSLYPNDQQPGLGLFVEQRLLKLVEAGGVTARVVAPVPWFFSGHERFGKYAQLARVARDEIRHGVAVTHPRYARLPKVGMLAAPLCMALGARATLDRIAESGFEFDVIDAHYLYPDGVAAALLGQWLNKPVVLTARGTDVNVIAQMPGPQRQIQWACERASRVITVSRALSDRLADIGVDREKLTVLRNGVDCRKFFPRDRLASRRAMGISPQAFVVASVGNLVELKGHDLVIEAVARQTDAALLIAGSGPERARLEQCAHACGASSRIRFLGQVDQQDLMTVYSAADVLVLASSREGWANVLLEAMACGTPVIATDVGGAPELVCDPAAGILIGERSASAIEAALQALRRSPPSRAATRAYAESFSWDATIDGYRTVLETAVATRGVSA